VQNHSTSESPAEELDYKQKRIELIQYRDALIKAMDEHRDDKILPLLARIATINLKILKIIQNENISKQ